FAVYVGWRFSIHGSGNGSVASSTVKRRGATAGAPLFGLADSLGDALAGKSLVARRMSLSADAAAGLVNGPESEGALSTCALTADAAASSMPTDHTNAAITRLCCGVVETRPGPHLRGIARP